MTVKPIFICSAVIALLAGSAWAHAGNGSYPNWKLARYVIPGTWSVSLDAGPFGLPGFNLAGAATLHRGGTVTIVDAGDFGGLGTRDTPQQGIWHIDRNGVRVTTLILSADAATGQLLHWQRVSMRLRFGESRNRLVGSVNVAKLACSVLDGIPPALTCPDPVAAADEFVTEPPFDVPVEFRRLRHAH